MDRRTTLQVPGCSGWHAAHVSRRRPGGLGWSQVAPGNDGLEGCAEIANDQARTPRGSSYRLYRPGNLVRGKELTSVNGAQGVWDVRLPLGSQRSSKVRKLQRALSGTSKQDKKKRFYSLYHKVWRADVLWEAWRQVQANKGAPGVDGLAIEMIINTG